MNQSVNPPVFIPPFSANPLLSQIIFTFYRKNRNFVNSDQVKNLIFFSHQEQIKKQRNY